MLRMRSTSIGASITPMLRKRDPRRWRISWQESLKSRPMIADLSGSMCARSSTTRPHCSLVRRSETADVLSFRSDEVGCPAKAFQISDFRLAKASLR